MDNVMDQKWNKAMTLAAKCVQHDGDWSTEPCRQLLTATRQWLQSVGVCGLTADVIRAEAGNIMTTFYIG
jgi:hypothetical protein